MRPSRYRSGAAKLGCIALQDALPVVEGFNSPRAWAFALLGLDAYCAQGLGDTTAIRLRPLLADRLMSALSAVETKGWVWFEDMLAYDNARLPQALILTGLATKTPPFVEAGLKSLRWLMALQTAPRDVSGPLEAKASAVRR